MVLQSPHVNGRFERVRQVISKEAEKTGNLYRTHGITEKKGYFWGSPEHPEGFSFFASLLK